MIKIFIAEDNEKINLMIKRILEASGEKFDIYEAKNGREAIEKISQIIPDVVILDIMMPGATGYEVCQTIKAAPETRNVKVLFVTAFGSGNTRKLALAHGGDALLIKPFTPEDLMANINKLLGRQ